MKYTNINEVINAQNANKAIIANTKTQIRFLTSVLKAQSSIDTTNPKVPGISNQTFIEALNSTTTAITEALGYYQENLKTLQKAQSKLRRIGRHMKAINEIEEGKEPKAKKATKKNEKKATEKKTTEKKASDKKATQKKAPAKAPAKAKAPKADQAA